MRIHCSSSLLHLVLPLFIQYNVKMDSISNSVTTISMGLVIISLCLKENMNTNSQIISRDIRLALADELIRANKIIIVF